MEVPLPRQEITDFVYVLGVPSLPLILRGTQFAPHSKIVRLEFLIVPTVWYYLFFM